MFTSAALVALYERLREVEAAFALLDPTNLIIAAPALLSGFLVSPAFYFWLGLSLLRGKTREKGGLSANI